MGGWTGPDPRRPFGFWLLVLVAVALFAVPSSASAADDEPTEEPTTAESVAPEDEDAGATEDEPEITPEDLPELRDDGLLSDEEEALMTPGCGTVDLPCVMRLDVGQAEVVAVGAGFGLMFLVAHTVGSWRHGRD